MIKRRIPSRTTSRGPVHIIVGQPAPTTATVVSKSQVKRVVSMNTPKASTRPSRTFSDDDWTSVVDAILATEGVSPEAKEEGAYLVQEWARHFWEIDREERTLAVEVGFHVRLDPHTYVIGIVDRLSVAPDGSLVVNEWKTTKGESQWWNEAEWLTRITASIQLPTYILALRHGRFTLKEGAAPYTISGSTSVAKVRVRAITKSHPPAFWPRLNHKLHTYDADALYATTNAYLNAANAIRELRRTKSHLDRDGLHTGPVVKSVPWQATGQWCRSYNRDCEFMHECRRFEYPHATPHHSKASDDLMWVAKFGLTPQVLADPQVVILSQSSYDTWATCAEKYRRTKLDPMSVLRHGGGGTAEQQLGSAVHAGLSRFYDIYK